MKPGWYILNYHDVNWETSSLLRGVGGTVPPDVFRRHVQQLGKWGKLIPVDAGLEMLRQGQPAQEPLFSFWFDDGLEGVRKFALPVLRQAGVTAGMSVCVRFALRQEMFWRFQLSYLAAVDGLRVLRSRLRPLGYTFGQSVRTWCLEQFSPEMRAILDAVYREFTPPDLQRDHFRVFDTEDGLRKLAEEGWLIANHTQAHYPVRGHLDRSFIVEQFVANEAFIQQLGGDGSCWVLPFGGGYFAAQEQKELYQSLRTGRQVTVVAVEGVPNTRQTLQDHGILFRIAATWTDASVPPFQVARVGS